MNNKGLILSLIILFSFVVSAGMILGVSLDRRFNPELRPITNVTTIISNITTITTTVTSTYQSNITYSDREYALNAVMVYDVAYIVEGGETYTLIYLWMPDGGGGLICCNSYLFDGAVQGVPLGAKANIYYREYTENFINHMVVTDIEVLSK